jgi:hypothetical protein
MRRLIFIFFLLPTLCFADEITYPTADTAVRDGKTYHLKKASPIYQKLEEAK